MPKEVRINDKMWYGKYKGMTMKDLLYRDRGFLDNMVDRGKIEFHQNVLDYLKNDTKQKKGWEPPIWGDGLYHPPFRSVADNDYGNVVTATQSSNTELTISFTMDTWTDNNQII